MAKEGSRGLSYVHSLLVGFGESSGGLVLVGFGDGTSYLVAGASCLVAGEGGVLVAYADRNIYSYLVAGAATYADCIELGGNA